MAIHNSEVIALLAEDFDILAELKSTLKSRESRRLA
jgi:hypothetical protein